MEQLKSSHLNQIKQLLKSSQPGDQSNRIEIEVKSESSYEEKVENDLFDTNPEVVQGFEQFLGIKDLNQSYLDYK